MRHNSTWSRCILCVRDTTISPSGNPALGVYMAISLSRNPALSVYFKFVVSPVPVFSMHMDISPGVNQALNVHGQLPLQEPGPNVS